MSKGRWLTFILLVILKYSTMKSRCHCFEYSRRIFQANIFWSLECFKNASHSPCPHLHHPQVSPLMQELFPHPLGKSLPENGQALPEHGQSHGAQCQCLIFLGISSTWGPFVTMKKNTMEMLLDLTGLLLVEQPLVTLQIIATTIYSCAYRGRWKVQR